MTVKKQRRYLSYRRSFCQDSILLFFIHELKKIKKQIDSSDVKIIFHQIMRVASITIYLSSKQIDDYFNFKRRQYHDY